VPGTTSHCEMIGKIVREMTVHSGVMAKGNDRLDVQDRAPAIIRADPAIVVELERYADQVGTGIVELLGQIRIRPALLRQCRGEVYHQGKNARQQGSTELSHVNLLADFQEHLITQSGG
jgi:hypothetical protein